MPLSVLSKLKYLYHCELEDMGNWEQNFIKAMHDGDDEQGGVGCLDPGTTDQELAEYLSPKRIHWINRFFRWRVEKPIMEGDHEATVAHVTAKLAELNKTVDRKKTG